MPADEFIKAFAAFLKRSGKFEIPEWGAYVKTACFKELAPYDADWLYVRAAAIARQIYMRRTIGTMTLRDHFGRKQRKGVKKNHHRRSAMKVIRHCMKQLQNMNLVGIVKITDEDKEISDGRQITKKGIVDMDRIASQFKKLKDQ